jgi:hypothetical protein
MLVSVLKVYRGSERFNGRGATPADRNSGLSFDLRTATTETGQSASSSVSAILFLLLSLPVLLSFKPLSE